MKIFNTPSVMIEEAKKAEHKHNPFLNLLISFGKSDYTYHSYGYNRHYNCS